MANKISSPLETSGPELAEPARWTALGLTALAVILPMTCWFSATAVAPELQIAWALSVSETSWLTNAVQLGFVIGALVSSIFALTDVLPLTRLMAGSALIVAISNGLLLLEPGGSVAIALRATTGAALAGIYPPSLKLIATWFRAGRGLAMGTMVAALTLGSALPHLIRASGTGLDWQVVIGSASIACVIAALMFARVIRTGPYPFPTARVDPRQIGAILRNRPVMLANLGYFGHMWELYAMWGWMLAFAGAASESSNWGLNASLLTFAVVAMGAPGALAGGWLADRIGRCNTTVLMMAISGSAALAIGLTFDGPLWLFAVVALIWGSTIVSDSAQFSAAVTELSDKTLVGSALAFQMGIGFAITIFTIWLVPLVAEALGSWRWSMLVLLPGPLVGAWAMLRLREMPESAAIAGGKR